MDNKARDYRMTDMSRLFVLRDDISIICARTSLDLRFWSITLTTGW